MMKVIYGILLVVALSFGAVLSYMVSFENQFIYFPDRVVQQRPSDIGLQYEEIHFQATDEVKLHGWYMPHESARFTLLHFHGNAGNISHRLPLYKRWHEMGLSVFAFDYRGYGKSTGNPDEAGLYNDARAAWWQLVTKYDISRKTIIISGRSLGAAIAAKLAGEVEAAGLALETPFTSIPDMASHYYPILPLRWLLHSQYNVRALVKSVHTPLLLISAENDEIVPAGMVADILAAANLPKTHTALAGDHNNFDMHSEKAYGEIWLTWIDQLSAMQKD